ncbi:MAG TPA: Rrf2 family transcriptional regulator [Ktedonobacterales bacterium]
MKLSEGVEWGLHCAALLAVLPPGNTLSGKALAEFHGVSESYLVKHLKAMARAGVLESVSGPKGGYRLARLATEITVLDIVDAVEGPRPAFRCTEIRQRGPAAMDVCAYRLPCAINVTMLQAETAWRGVLRAQTLADLVAHVAQTIPDSAVAKSLGWMQAKMRT